MKKLVFLMFMLYGLTGCTSISNMVNSREDEYATQAKVQPVSKIPPGSLLSQQNSH